MMGNPELTGIRPTDNAQSIDALSLARHFGGGEGLLPLWIAEPYLTIAPGIREALGVRAGAGWYGYETRPGALDDAFWDWMATRHQWDQGELRTLTSPSVGTSIGVLIEQLIEPGDGVILQPPVFTDFKPLVVSAGRSVISNPLLLTEAGYRLDLDDLAKKAADPATRLLILCNPHNPVGRVWTKSELADLVAICGQHGIFVIADEIHADVTLAAHTFTPLATAAVGTQVRWAALHGPIKTFGLAGVCDSLVITDDDQIVELFQSTSSRLHLTRNNVFGLVAFEAAYETGAPWVDELLQLVESNASLLAEQLPDEVGRQAQALPALPSPQPPNLPAPASSVDRLADDVDMASAAQDLV